MVTVVFEGPDGGGKSTLIDYIQESLESVVVRSEGPEKYPGEINDRILRYLKLDGELPTHCDTLLFDRHPCVSQLAYGLVHNQSEPSSGLVEVFYSRKPLFIYCRPTSRNNHTATGDWDTPEYLEKVNKNFDKLMAFYDEWALRHAHMIYRIGDSMDDVVKFIETHQRS